MKNLIAVVSLIIAIVAMIFVFKGDGDIYSHLPDGNYDVKIISVRVKGDDTLSQILLDNETETGMEGVPVSVQIKEWERFSGRDADCISAGEDILLPCYIKK
jgi:hypothetical protein|nr:MAG TPA: hypothetical protein [Caudoviricetes sp.]